MLLTILGDVHGETQAVFTAIDFAVDNKAKTIMQLGDFGYWPGEKGVIFFDEINEYAKKRGVKIYALGGNHDWWPQWNNTVKHGPKDSIGFALVRQNIRLAPRVHYWTWQGKQCLAVAGAYSIDKAQRTTGLSWWPEETLTQEDMDQVLNKKVDYLFTHDASDRMDMAGLMPIWQSQQHRLLIDEVLRRSMPDIHFHGHYHRKYEWLNRTGSTMNSKIHYTMTYGLDFNYNEEVMGILNTQAVSGETAFRFRSEIRKKQLANLQ